MPGPILTSRTCSSTALVNSSLQVWNSRGHQLRCSHYVPLNVESQAVPCVIYCHGNSGSRLDADDAIRLLLPEAISVFALDFSGSGLSDGEDISLGWYERHDLASVVKYLRETEHVTEVGLWGRSMGAATCFLYAHMDMSIKGMVLDSSFSSLTELMLDMANSDHAGVKIPKMLTSTVLGILRKAVQQRAHFDIDKMSLTQTTLSCRIPALFAHAKQDTFIPINHCHKLFERYRGAKNLVT